MRGAAYAALGVVFLFCGCFTACPFHPSLKPDSEIFGDFEPLAFEGDYDDDDYIIAASEYPAQIQVWKRTDKNTDEESAELIHTYSFQKGEFNKDGFRSISLLSVAMLRGNIWICGEGVQKNFMRLNMASGKLTFLELDCIPTSVLVVPQNVDGTGTVWVATRAAEGVGIAIRQLDDDGNITEKYNVSHDDLAVLDITGLHYVDNKYLLCASTYNRLSLSDYADNSKTNAYKLIDLSATNDNYVTEISCVEVFTETFLTEHLSSNVPEEFLVSFWSYGNNNFVSPSIIGYSSKAGKILVYRFLYRITQWSPIKLEALNININNRMREEDELFFFHVAESGSSVYITGNVGHNSGDALYFDGLETRKYKIDGKLEKTIRMEHANKINKTTRANKTWFNKSVYVQDQTTREWIDTGQAIYRLDHDTETVWKINADGTKEAMQAERVLLGN
ncbi:MAG: hypothetical protein IJ191_08805 [Treponema sp.]|nr:hypothetical protein [Treponema sp.]